MAPFGHFDPISKGFRRGIWPHLANMAKMAQNGPKWPKMGQKGSFWANNPHVPIGCCEGIGPLGPRGPKRVILGHFGPFGQSGPVPTEEVTQNGVILGHFGPKWPKMAQNGPKWPFWAILATFNGLQSGIWAPGAQYGQNGPK